MDPDRALEELRDAYADVDQLNTPDTPDAVYAATDRLLVAVAALDGWLSRGGFPPEAWASHGDHPWPHSGCVPASTSVEDVQRELDVHPTWTGRT